MFKNTHIWLGNYIQQGARRLVSQHQLSHPIHIMFCFVDHFEPEWGGADLEIQRKRVKEWMDKYPSLASRYKDADGCYPKHSFFYPAEVYTKEHLDQLAFLCRDGFGEVEVHLHHDNDTEEGFRESMEKAKSDFSAHGLLGKDKKTGDIRYGFIHGNWSLNNSRPDGRWCGVNNESQILKKTGCYADFTFPSAPSDTQTEKINSIYYDIGGAAQPKSHNTGRDVAVEKGSHDELMIIQGPLALNWTNRKIGIFPKIENGDITGNNPPYNARVDLWVEQNICVKNRPEWVFVKIHTHGAQEKNARALLGDPFDQMCAYLEKKYNDGKSYILHYTTAREMYNIIKAAEAGETGDPDEYRDYIIIRNS
ncbi:hypothetical protein MNBD_UNCLBAC01-933 [hydrothermal vent metagenome]|uniref:Uncharacterized protein n=1 Tax=hydrothermal vent metagenome TaxID=652676 RepID=A0A3B1DQW1_9ZZZZ